MPKPVLPLDVLQVYVYYDTPRIFSCRDQTGQLLFAQTVEDTDESEILLLCPVTTDQLAQLVVNDVPLRSAFDGTFTSEIYSLEIPFDEQSEPRVQSLTPAEVPDEWKTGDDVYLSTTIDDLS